MPMNGEEFEHVEVIELLLEWKKINHQKKGVSFSAVVEEMIRRQLIPVNNGCRLRGQVAAAQRAEAQDLDWKHTIQPWGRDGQPRIAPKEELRAFMMDRGAGDRAVPLSEFQQFCDGNVQKRKLAKGYASPAQLVCEPRTTGRQRIIFVRRHEHAGKANLSGVNKGSAQDTQATHAGNTLITMAMSVKDTRVKLKKAVSVPVNMSVSLGNASFMSPVPSAASSGQSSRSLASRSIGSAASAQSRAFSMSSRAASSVFLLLV